MHTQIFTKSAISYAMRQLAYRAGVSEAVLNAAPATAPGFESLGVKVHYDFPDRVRAGERAIIIVPCREEAWRELIEPRDAGLEWLPTDRLVTEGGRLPFSDPVPVLFQGAGREDGDRPFVERRKDGAVIFHADILAATFFMLSRWEETVVPVRDLHGRFPASACVAYREGFLDRPVIDEYALILQCWLKALLPGWLPKPRQFSLRLSHDVDMVRSFSGLYRTTRAFAGDIVKRRSLRKARETVRTAIRSSITPEDDPIYGNILELADHSERYGLKSSFYFMAADEGPNDSGYDPAEPLVRRCIDEIARRGHEIGFHPSYRASFDTAVWQKEFARLSAVANGIPIAGGRQHFLRFRAPDTWRLWEQAGLSYDSTLSYADCEGFRCGTCLPFRPFDVGADRELSVTEIPLIVMDGTLCQYRGLTPMEGEARILALADQCRRVGGVFTLLWHNSSLTGEWESWAPVYRRVVGKLAGWETKSAPCSFSLRNLQGMRVS